MLTSLSILSLDQGKIWKDPSPLPREDAAADPQEAPKLVESRWSLSALFVPVACLSGARGETRQA
jgi:hypothetical protein